MKKIITAQNAPAALGPYSHAVSTDALVFTSGQLGMDPATGTLAGEGIQAQTEQALVNVENVLAAAGLTFANVVKTTIFLTDLTDFATVNGIYASRFPSEPPARSCVQVAALPAGARIEIEVIAAR
ncbi:MAG: RidA family protein [Oscillospiraceae bacterium]|nr:RidA family protein [Oscillospiraceae bacterium]